MTANSTKSAIKDAAKDVSEAAKSAAAEKAEAAKATAAEKTEAEAAEWSRAASSFGDDSFSHQAAQHLATRLSDAAVALRSTDLSSLHHDVTDFARRHPLMFFGGAAVLGFAAARAMKASERAERRGAAELQGDDADLDTRQWGYS